MIKIFDIETRKEIINEDILKSLQILFHDNENVWVDVFGEKDGHHFQIEEAYRNGEWMRKDYIEDEIYLLSIEHYVEMERLSIR